MDIRNTLLRCTIGWHLASGEVSSGLPCSDLITKLVYRLYWITAMIIHHTQNRGYNQI